MRSAMYHSLIFLSIAFTFVCKSALTFSLQLSYTSWNYYKPKCLCETIVADFEQVKNEFMFQKFID